MFISEECLIQKPKFLGVYLFPQRKVLTNNKFPVKEWWDAEYHPKDIPRKEYKEGDVVAVFDADTVVFSSFKCLSGKDVIVTNAKGQQKESLRTKQNLNSG